MRALYTLFSALMLIAGGLSVGVAHRMDSILVAMLAVLMIAVGSLMFGIKFGVEYERSNREEG